MKRHGTDVVSLTFGLIFLLLAGWWVLGRAVDIALPTLGWVVALGLVAVGALGLVAALRGGAREAAGSGWHPGTGDGTGDGEDTE
jgi:hypothetical protein